MVADEATEALPADAVSFVGRLRQLAGARSGERLEDAIARLHHPACRKRIYDPLATPCSCADEAES